MNALLLFNSLTIVDLQPFRLLIPSRSVSLAYTDFHLFQDLHLVPVSLECFFFDWVGGKPSSLKQIRTTHSFPTNFHLLAKSHAWLQICIHKLESNLPPRRKSSQLLEFSMVLCFGLHAVTIFFLLNFIGNYIEHSDFLYSGRSTQANFLVLCVRIH